MEGKAPALVTCPPSSHAHQPYHTGDDVSTRQSWLSRDRADNLLEFRHFARLPAEIRREIWNLAIYPSSGRIYIPYTRQRGSSGRRHPHYRCDVLGLMLVWKEVWELFTRNRKLGLILARRKLHTAGHVDRMYGWGHWWRSRLSACLS